MDGLPYGGLGEYINPKTAFLALVMMNLNIMICRFKNNRPHCPNCYDGADYLLSRYEEEGYIEMN
jgi:hypothetical protein